MIFFVNSNFPIDREEFLPFWQIFPQNETVISKHLVKTTFSEIIPQNRDQVLVLLVSS